MTPIDEIDLFLRDFKFKTKFYGVYIDTTRIKNLQTMADLELNPRQITTILNEIVATDYSQGPIEDDDDGPNLWIFGCQIRGNEIYVKITMGNFNDRTICISFHKSAWPMNYPYKT